MTESAHPSRPLVSAPDLANLPRFLAHLEEVDPSSAAFARVVLADGANVKTFWGPQQMDVWELRMRRGQMLIRFGIERGLSDGVLYGRASADGPKGMRHVRLAVLAWARATGAPLSLDDPDQTIDLAANGLAALDWVEAGNGSAVDRATHAWRDYHDKLSKLRVRTRGNPSDDDLRDMKSAGVAAMERAVDYRAGAAE